MRRMSMSDLGIMYIANCKAREWRSTFPGRPVSELEFRYMEPPCISFHLEIDSTWVASHPPCVLHRLYILRLVMAQIRYIPDDITVQLGGAVEQQQYLSGSKHIAGLPLGSYFISVGSVFVVRAHVWVSSVLICFLELHARGRDV